MTDQSTFNTFLAALERVDDPATRDALLALAVIFRDGFALATGIELDND